MSKAPKEWNPLRACFILLATIILAQILLGFSMTMFCAYNIVIHDLPIGTCRELAPNVMELMVGGLAIVIAFSKYGGNK